MYAQTLDYLFSQLPVYQRIGPAAYKKDLTNTLALCAHLGNPHHRFPTIHVGGTNGKGSVSHILASVLQAAGYKTGLYISPHYKDFRERIKINGKYIPRKRVVDFVAQHKAALETIQPSFFEMTVAMAFDYFAREKVDVAVIEVGLGGRLDSTNVITPLLSVITNISYDHMNMLGDTLAKIAFEKAGIIKPGIPVVIGETHPESAPVFLEKAGQTGADICFADQRWQLTEATENEQGQTIYSIVSGDKETYPTVLADVGGPFQAKNVATALQAIEILQQRQLLRLDTAAVLEGLAKVRENTRFIGRWQIIGRNPLTLCDSAHNEAGIRMAFGRIGQMPHQRLHIVVGFVNDKDVDKALSYFPKGARYYFAKANLPRAMEAAELQGKANAQQLEGRAYTSVRRALQAARRAAAPEDMIVVIGSIFVVAEVI
jgi:dihydrofolate synthase / folylpolyglutamate synthase